MCKSTDKCKCSTKILESVDKWEENDLLSSKFLKFGIVPMRHGVSDDGTIVTEGQAVSPFAVCPHCGAVSYRVHSWYTRVLKDSPVLGDGTVLVLNVRRFFCDNGSCEYRTFSEQPGELINRYQRMTSRCKRELVEYGLHASAVKTAGVLCKSGIGVSHDTALRAVASRELPDFSGVRRIGVDDWAFRKGVKYGSVIVDLDTHAVVDVLEGRGRKVFKDWLLAHPDVELVSRDRASEYSCAVEEVRMETGREIVEVADRFHLLKNMNEALAEAIKPHVPECKARLEDHPESGREAPPEEDAGSDPRQEVFDGVKALQTNGKNAYQISASLHIGVQLAAKYMTCDTLPPKLRRWDPKDSRFDGRVKAELEAGKDWEEVFKGLVADGFKNTEDVFKRHYGIKEEEGRVISKRTISSLATKKIMRDLDRKPKKGRGGWSREDEEMFTRLCSFDWFRELYESARSFYKTITGSSKDELDNWLSKHTACDCAPIKSLANGIMRDYIPVRNCIIYKEVSNGVLEGTVNRLKVVKRVMYGRAGVKLLRTKMIG